MDLQGKSKDKVQNKEERPYYIFGQVIFTEENITHTTK